MNTLTAKYLIEKLESRAKCVNVMFSDSDLIVELEDGRTVTVPLVYYPRLYHGSTTERKNWVIEGEGIHWPDLDEDISTENLLSGKPSGESQSSFKRWLEQRT